MMASPRDKRSRGFFYPSQSIGICILICIFRRSSRDCGSCGQTFRAPMCGGFFISFPKYTEGRTNFYKHSNVDGYGIKQDVFNENISRSIFWMMPSLCPIYGGCFFPDLWAASCFYVLLSTPRGVYPQFFASYPQKREKRAFPPVFHSPKYGGSSCRNTGRSRIAG